MSQEIAGQHEKDCFRTLFINFVEELKKYKPIVLFRHKFMM